MKINMSMVTPPPTSPPANPAALRQMLFGFWVVRALYVAAELGLADLLAVGPKTSDVVTILRSCRRAMKPSARLLVVEQLVQPGNAPDPVRLLDLEMLVLLGGRERTAEELRTLLAASGFSLARVGPTRLPLAIVEAVPV